MKRQFLILVYDRLAVFPAWGKELRTPLFEDWLTIDPSVSLTSLVPWSCLSMSEPEASKTNQFLSLPADSWGKQLHGTRLFEDKLNTKTHFIGVPNKNIVRCTTSIR